MKIQYIDEHDKNRKVKYGHIPCYTPLDLVLGLWYFNASKHKNNINVIHIKTTDNVNNLSMLPGYGTIHDIVEMFAKHNKDFVKPTLRGAAKN